MTGSVCMWPWRPHAWVMKAGHTQAHIMLSITHMLCTYMCYILHFDLEWLSISFSSFPDDGKLAGNVRSRRHVLYPRTARRPHVLRYSSFFICFFPHGLSPTHTHPRTSKPPFSEPGLSPVLISAVISVSRACLGTGRLGSQSGAKRDNSCFPLDVICFCFQYLHESSISVV